jgi:hypothetical protein
MRDDRPWNRAIVDAQRIGRNVRCFEMGNLAPDAAATEWQSNHGGRRVAAGALSQIVASARSPGLVHRCRTTIQSTPGVIGCASGLATDPLERVVVVVKDGAAREAPLAVVLFDQVAFVAAGRKGGCRPLR